MKSAAVFAVIFVCAMLPQFLPQAALPAETEDDWNQRFCSALGGAAEARLEVPNGAPGGRVDCMTDLVAWEMDWSRKRDECLGQALRYGAQTGRQPGCVLIIKERRDCRYALELLETVAYWDLPVTITTTGGRCDD